MRELVGLSIVMGCVCALAAPPDPRFTPYADDPDHPWNRLHEALFVRTDQQGMRRVHTVDPLLYGGGRHLLEGEPHRRAIEALDAFLAPGAAWIDEPARRLMLQRDLWAAFDYLAWYPDDWVNQSRDEAAAIALRGRLAKAIGRLALDAKQIESLGDNYALAAKGKEFAADHDRGAAERPFLPADLFDENGPWVRFHASSATLMTKQHFDACKGRAAHVVFLRLPGGKAATEKYLEELSSDPVKQFPEGTMVAMVRRALAITPQGKMVVTPITELVQLRAYRRIPADPRANRNGDFGEQDMHEFVLDRHMWFAGKHGLRPVSADAPFEPFARTEGDPFLPGARENNLAKTQLKSCIQCHQAPGVQSVLSLERVRSQTPRDYGTLFRTFALEVELSYTPFNKRQRYDWGLLQGLLEGTKDR